jgi:hypothetical protein
MSTNENYFKIKKGLQFDDGSNLTSTNVLLTANSSGTTATFASVILSPFTLTTSTSGGTGTGTIVLSHFDSEIQDDSGHVTMTAHGSTSISTAQSKFGGSSVYFPSGVANTITFSNDSVLAFGLDDYTIECWVYVSSFDVTGNVDIFTLNTDIDFSAPNFSVFGLTWNGSNFATGVFIDANALNSSFIGTLGSWHHVSTCRQGSNVYCSIDGQVSGPVTVSTNFTDITGAQMHADYYGSYAYSGYIDEFRITRGSALYTSDFTPPSSPFTYSSGGASNNLPTPGQPGQVFALSNTGRLIYWDVTNSRWSYISDGSAV